MFNGKMKALTFSYDDGVTQDIRLIEILNKYNLKATFNINSELLGKSGELNINGIRIAHNKIPAADVPSVYKGHEIAVHTLTHPNLTQCDEAEVLRQVREDRNNLIALAGYDVNGMAYPGGGINNNHFIAELIGKETEIKYARTTICNSSFDVQQNLLEFRPTVFHKNWDMMYELADRFFELTPATPQVFYIWGHSYEFDIDNSWDKFEEFCRYVSGKEDVFYATNREALLAE